MPFRINPIMAGLIVALPNLVLAVEHGQITINDPSGATTIVLDPGDTVTHAGTGAAIDVSIAGNRLVRTRPSSPPATPPTAKPSAFGSARAARPR